MKKLSIALIISAVTSYSAQAKTYLGLDLGVADKTNIEAKLKQANANFENDYGYKGYAQDLPIIKLNQYHVISKHGNVKEAWLHFSPDSVLYKIDVTYRDSGGVVSIFKDSLDAKYGSTSFRGRGFNQSATYYDDDVEIKLARNTFGFGNDQTTSLTYTYSPAENAVEDMKAKIRAHISKQNAKKASADL